MALTILSAAKFGAKRLKATIQGSGRLGFTDVTRAEMKLSDSTYIYIAQGESLDDLYMIVTNEKNEDAFRVRKSGTYYYIATTNLFDELKYDYKKTTIIFDLIRDESKDKEAPGMVYKMNKREIKKKKGGSM